MLHYSGIIAPKGFWTRCIYTVCHINYFMWMLGFVRHLPITESANTGIILHMCPAIASHWLGASTKQSLQTGGSGCPEGLYIGPALWQPIGSADCSFLSNIGQQHYGDVIIRTMASQITHALIVCSAVCSGTDQRKHQSFVSLAFVRWIHQRFPSQWASNAENVSIWWRHHDISTDNRLCMLSIGRHRHYGSR